MHVHLVYVWVKVDHESCYGTFCSAHFFVYFSLNAPLVLFRLLLCCLERQGYFLSLAWESLVRWPSGELVSKRVLMDTSNSYYHASVNFERYHPPRATPWQIFKTWQIPVTLANFFYQMPGPQACLGPFILMNFTLFHHFQDLSH